jgi:hypothetical protein
MFLFILQDSLSFKIIHSLFIHNHSKPDHASDQNLNENEAKVIFKLNVHDNVHAAFSFNFDQVHYLILKDFE